MRTTRDSEASLIRLIQRTVSTRGHVQVSIGDDACVLRDGTVVTTDAYAEGVHFDLSYMTARQIGERCACAALSDVVAMGAKPEVLLVALCLSGRSNTHAVKNLYLGIERVCAELGCEVAGGDIIRSITLSLTLTALGKTNKPLLRSSARPGDSLYVTGSLGAAEAGRLALLNRLAKAPNRRLIARHLKPLPRLKAMLKLKPLINALIDTSDGIATDARHLAEESNVRVTLESGLLPILPETKKLCSMVRTEPFRFALCAGEDYELLFTSSASVPGVVAGTRVTRIGRIEKGSGLYLNRNGRLRPLLLSGYDHMCTP